MDCLKCFRVFRASQVALVVKNPPANAGVARNVGSIPGLRRSPGEGNGNPLQYSFLRPHRRQPTRLPRPRDSPGKNTGVGCYFLLQNIITSAMNIHF